MTRLQWSQQAGQDCLIATGWTAAELAELARLTPAELAGRFSVSTADELGRSGGMAGRFDLAGGAVVFTPRFPFAADTAYALIDRAAAAVEAMPTLLRPAQPARPSTSVLEIYPTTPAVPLNLLRVYVQFSAPMSEGFAELTVQLSDTDTGEPLADALLPMRPELWDPHRTRLTLLLDPGRIKRGLRTHTDAGYPLAEGRRVTISVEPAFLDAAAAPLIAPGRRNYRVEAAERRHVRPADWVCQRPPARTRQPLTVTFDRPMDHALALRCLHVRDASGATVDGVASLEPGETQWRFTPAGEWRPAIHTLTANPILEDTAGNSISRVFDRDLGQAADDPIEAAPTILHFCPDSS